MTQFAGALAQNKAECANFKTGKFNYRDSASNVVNVIRTNKFQSETNMQTGVKTKLKIHWIADCTYRLTQIWSNDRARRRNNRSVTDVKITNVYNDRYDYSCACKDSSYSKTSGGTMVFIK
jgi:hypothetical protein